MSDLRSRDGMTEDQAKSWIESKTKRAFDPQAMYKLRWPMHADSNGWTDRPDLKIHIMTDAELNSLEREVIKNNKRPQREPWEPPMYESARGRA